jgi:hypothetical protein
MGTQADQTYDGMSVKFSHIHIMGEKVLEWLFDDRK